MVTETSSGRSAIAAAERSTEGPSSWHPQVDGVRVAAYTVPTDSPESDGTLEWTATTLIVAEIEAGGRRGLGYTYADATAGRLIKDVLAPVIDGGSAWAIGDHWRAMVAAVRNMGRPGIAATAISAVDIALWDLKARLLSLPLSDLLGRCRDEIEAYGSGGFTSYDDTRLSDQLSGWADAGFRAVKMKIGRDPAADPHRLDIAREAIGPDVALFVDANGAYDRRQAVRVGESLGARGVTWFEEPVSSDDVDGLRFLRDHVPAGVAVAAGEYAWGPDEIRRLLVGEAVDVLQLDVTRCLGITGFLAGASIAEAMHVPLSAHCAPALHAHLMLAARPGIHLEWFHDHTRIEHLLFDGAPDVVDGVIRLDGAEPGLGLSLRTADAQPFLDWSA